MTIYCFRCGAIIPEDIHKNLRIGKCPECKRKTEFVDFPPTLKNCIEHGMRNRVIWFGSPYWYRRVLLCITDKGERIYGYI